MQLESARLQLAILDEEVVAPASAGLLTLVGCASAILGAFLPWGEKVLFGISVAKSELQIVEILLAGLALTSAGIAILVLLRRPASAPIVVILIVLALAQLGVAIWNASNIVQFIAQSDPRQIPIRTIGTGATLGVLGSLITLAGGIVAWTKRERWSDATAESA